MSGFSRKVLLKKKTNKHFLCLGHNFCVRQSCCARGQKRIIHALRNVYILDDLKKFHLFLLYETKRKMLEISPTMPPNKATKKKQTNKQTKQNTICVSDTIFASAELLCTRPKEKRSRPQNCVHTCHDLKKVHFISFV